MSTITTMSTARARCFFSLMLSLPLAACGAPTGGGEGGALGQATEGLAAGGGEVCTTVVEATTIPLPEGVLRPRNSGIVPDADQGVLFRYTDSASGDARLGYIHGDGAGFRCLSCASGGGALAGLLPAQTFPDGRRFLAQKGASHAVGEIAYSVVECSPSLAACDTVTALPITGFPGGVKLQDRVPKLSPDGSTLVWTRIRPDGYFMVAGALERGESGYHVGEVRVLNPPPAAGSGPVGALAVSTSWYEAKSVSHDGRTLAFAATLGDSLNLDWFLMDLATGSVQRLTRDPDWDEGGQMAPGGHYMTGGSSRGGEVMASLAALPRPPLIDDAVIGAVANYYLPRGDALPDIRHRRSRLIPQLLDLDCADTDAGLTPVGNDEEGWIGDGGGSNVWARDGVHFVNGERREDDSSTTRLRLFTILGAPENHDPPAPMVIPAWAPRLADLPAPLPSATLRTLHNPGGGSVTISRFGDMALGDFVASYHGYVVNGCARIDGVQRASALGALTAHYKEDLTLSGCESGESHVDVYFADALTTGEAHAVRNGVVHDRSFGLGI